MQGYLEKTVVEQDFPFRVFQNEGYYNTPHHWHEDVEIIYQIEGKLKAGIGNTIYNLEERDILIISSGQVHYFYKEAEWSNRAVVQFKMSVYDTFLSGTKDANTIRPMFNHSKLIKRGSDVHILMEKQINELIQENLKREDGYKLILKARLYDLAGILIRYMPKQIYSSEGESHQLEKLQKLDIVFQYVGANYQKTISLEEISKIAGFSKYHFARFFKENTGITFLDYLNKFKITKAEWLLMDEKDSITEVAYKAGFNSVKSFNRVFKQEKGCSPMKYRQTTKGIISK